MAVKFIHLIKTTQIELNVYFLSKVEKTAVVGIEGSTTEIQHFYQGIK